LKINRNTIFCLAFLVCCHFSLLAQTAGLDRSQHSLLWEISGNGLKHPAYLFGTFHNNALELFDQPDSVFYALNQANAVSLEVDITSIMGQYDLINSGQSIPSSLKWMVQDPKNVTYTKYGSDAGRPQFLDLYFNQVADQCDKAFIPLETIEDQMAISLSFGRKRTDNPSAKPISMEEMKRLYLEGRMEKLHDVTKESCMVFENLYEDLLVNRNYKMADGMDTLMHQYRLFCAVGAAHLGGPEGIIPILRKRGYTLRRVEPTFTENRKTYLDEIAKCEGFIYTNKTYGFQLNLDGRPRTEDDKDGSHSLIYQEMGQGNLFSLYCYQMESLYSLKEIWDNALANVSIVSLSEFKQVKLYNGTTAYQAFIKTNDEQFWLRIFVRNGIAYFMHATGGARFLNSTRANKFFDRFRFLVPEDDSPIPINKSVKSPTGRMTMIMPEKGLEFQDEEREIRFWRRKFFDPHSGESFFMYESILQNDFLYYTDDNFGSHLIAEFEVDSISFYNEIDSIYFSEKSFKAVRQGQTFFGRIRQLGNILHYAQYAGSDSLRAVEFLSSMVYVPFAKPTKFFTEKRDEFQARTTIAGFNKIDNLEEYNHRTSNHYTLNDIENAITYEILVKTYRPWSFIDEPLDSILYHQIIWPDTFQVKANYSFDFYDQDSVRYMNFEIHYKQAKNSWKGKVSAAGRDIRLATIVYPYAAGSEYGEIPFLDSIVFFENSASSLNQINMQLLQKKINGTPKDRDDVKEFFAYDHLKPATAWELLNQLENIGTKRTDTKRSNSLRSLLFSKLNDTLVTEEIFNFWKNHLVEEGNDFALSGIELFSGKSNTYLIPAIELLTKYEKFPTPSYQLIENIEAHPEWFISVWGYVTKLYAQGDFMIPFLNMMESLVSIPFYKSYLESDEFVKSVTNAAGKEWILIRYFELILQTNPDKAFLLLLNKKINGTTPELNGIKIALNEALNGKKLKGKQRKLLEQNVFVAIGYAAVSNLFRDLPTNYSRPNSGLSQEQELGLLAYYYYLDEIEVPDHKLKWLFNVITPEDDKAVRYALFEATENGNIYFFARKILEPNVYPRLVDYGNEIFLLERVQDFTPEEAIRQLMELK
jgi:uncharacterized protein YbaP (TraB family)